MLYQLFLVFEKKGLGGFFLFYNNEPFRMESSKKVAESSKCIYCDYSTDRSNNMKKHLLSAKHQKRTKTNLFEPKVAKSSKLFLSCKNCGKFYKSKSGLWSHLKTCEYKPEKLVNIIDKEFVMDLLKQNGEMCENIIKNLPVTSNANQSYNTTNSHNKNFNLQFFLNETCKNAMNITDFVDSLEIKSGELEDMGKLGYVKGISNILIRSLNELDETERPLHCTDKKRETMYVKDNDIWEKDVESVKIGRLIKDVSHKNFKKIPFWKEENPASQDSSSKKHLEYMQILNQVMSSINSEEEDDGIQKIHKSLCLETYLGKNRKNEFLIQD